MASMEASILRWATAIDENRAYPGSTRTFTPERTVGQLTRWPFFMPCRGRGNALTMPSALRIGFARIAHFPRVGSGMTQSTLRDLILGIHLLWVARSWRCMLAPAIAHGSKKQSM